jgi:hypothetical protein
MLKAVKDSVHRMTSHLQLISGYLEMQNYTNALGKTRETIKEMHSLAASLTGECRDDRAGRWGGRGSAWLRCGELRRRER